MKINLTLIIILLIFFGTTRPKITARRINALHITFDEGCKKDFQEVAQKLRINLISCFVKELDDTMGNDIYNIGPCRARRIWDRHKDFFNTFDVIITSDTTPLSRIFLQNGWEKPLIIWVHNRFDYAYLHGGEEEFPDSAYYELMRKATTMPNVRIVCSTPYERVYARAMGIEFGDLCIKPIGRKIELEYFSAIPSDIDKKDTIFVYPCPLKTAETSVIMESCKSLGIKAYTGGYNGPEDLRDFKGVLYFPDEWSNIILFEGLQRGVIFFVPSKKFVHDNQHMMRASPLCESDLCEWYAPGNSSCMVYFDSWQDLKNKVMQDHTELKQLCIYVGAAHREIMLSNWRTLFVESVLRKTFVE